MNERRPAARAAWRILLPSRPLPLVATIFALVFFGLASGYGLAHGLFSKPLVGQKSNAATRGQAGANATELWFMTPQRSSYGRHESIGWDITLQDEDASTSENVRLAFVQYANDGKSPDASNAGEIVSLQVPVFGRGPLGQADPQLSGHLWHPDASSPTAAVSRSPSLRARVAERWRLGGRTAQSAE
jgi:hypothetical protein